MLHYIYYESASQTFAYMLIHIYLKEQSYGVLNYELL